MRSIKEKSYEVVVSVEFWTSRLKDVWSPARLDFWRSRLLDD